MTAQDALRFLAHEAVRWNGDAQRALPVLLPQVMKVLHLPPMDDLSALDFTFDLRKALAQLDKSPLSECNCKQCGFVEALLCPGNMVLHWCTDCGRETLFVRVETTSFTVEETES